MRKLRKLKFDPKISGIYLGWDNWDKASGVLKEHTLKCSERPRKELKEAILGMREHLIEQCELPLLEGEADDVRIRGLTITENKDGIRGLVITGIRELRNSESPLVLNSPHFVEESENELAKGVFSDQCGADLDEVARLAFEYIDGSREQSQLDLDAAAKVRKAQEKLRGDTLTVRGETFQLPTEDDLELLEDPQAEVDGLSDELASNADALRSVSTGRATLSN